jgi:hypothetical protein
VILLDLPDRTQLRMNDSEARALADRLWELARQRGGTAAVAIAIEDELDKQLPLRQPIEVPNRAAELLTELLSHE